jgi:large subunit ribosomal protein L17
MHRHGYKGRKLGRERDQRRALIKGLSSQLIEHHSIRTTLPKAKELRPYVEKLVTKARKGNLANRRLVIAKVSTKASAHHLFDVVAPKLKRESGYLRIQKDGFRRGDNAAMAIIEFVDKDEFNSEPKPKEAKADTKLKAEKKPATNKTEAKKPAAKKADAKEAK